MKIKKIISIFSLTLLIFAYGACSGGKYLYSEDLPKNIEKIKVVEKDIIKLSNEISKNEIVIKYTTEQINILQKQANYLNSTKNRAFNQLILFQKEKVKLEKQFKKEKDKK